MHKKCSIHGTPNTYSVQKINLQLCHSLRLRLDHLSVLLPIERKTRQNISVPQWHHPQHCNFHRLCLIHSLYLHCLWYHHLYHCTRHDVPMSGVKKKLFICIISRVTNCIYYSYFVHVQLLITIKTIYLFNIRPTMFYVKTSATDNNDLCISHLFSDNSKYLIFKRSHIGILYSKEL